MPTLEADDAMGIYATKHPGNMIVSPDKDMKQIPGKLYNLNETFTVTLEEGARDAFKEKNLTEEDALVNARLAKILTVDDYDFTKNRPILWDPSPDYRVNV
jgi:DNA polymerase-1